MRKPIKNNPAIHPDENNRIYESDYVYSESKDNDYQ